ncbi:MAG: hypothetical protein MI866_08890 [Bacteroidales bacterium]|nr:hypothetical protein [Bacteroidales bacterium]
MNGFKVNEEAKKEEQLEQKMFPQMYQLEKEDMLKVRGGRQHEYSVDCDAVCGSE